MIDDAAMRFSLDPKVLFSLLLPLAVAACGDGGSGGSGGTGGTGGDGGSGATGGSGGQTASTTADGGGGSGGAPMECEGPGYEGNEPVVSLGVVQAVILDQNGDPTPDNAVQLCGIDVCDYANTSASGAVTFNANKDMVKPALKLGDGLIFAKLAILVPEGDSTYTDITTAKLPPVGEGDTFAAGASVKSGGMIIDVPAGGSVVVDELLYPEPGDQVFRAAEIPTTENTPLDPAMGFEMLFGVAPMETIFCPAATLHVPNTPGWEAGAAVEFFIQGVEIGQHWAPYGEWQKVSDGKVSEDGLEVVTAEGQGIPVLSSVAVRLAK